MRILIADDSTVIRDRLKILLSDIPRVVVVDTVSSGPEAVDQFERLRPDVTLLDIRMPGGNGIDALSEIKQRDPSTAVVVLTNYPEDQYRRLCEAAGADFFLDKSTEFERMPEVIGQLMEARTDKPRGAK